VFTHGFGAETPGVMRSPLKVGVGITEKRRSCDRALYSFNARRP
jgi:hypothetical protein